MRSLLVLIVLFSFLSAAGQDRLKLIDSFISKRTTDYELSGNVLVAEKGKPLYTRSIGFANAANNKPNNQEAAFQLASVSKLFTAVAILQLKEKGKLKLDDAVKKYVPELNNQSITIRQLLTHTSGLADYQVLEKPYSLDTAKVFENKDIPAAINNDSNAFRSAPGERWSYSNTGYNLLALVVEKLGKLPFQDYLKQKIFIPAGMAHTYIASTLINLPDSNRTVGYDYPAFAPWIMQRADSLPRNHIELVHLNGLLGQGNIFSTTADLLKFDRALYQGKIVTKASLQEAFTPTRLSNGELATAGWKNTIGYQGLGWRILKDTSLGKVVFHSGGEPGAVTMFIRDITKDQTIIVLNNVTHRSTHNTAMSLLYLLNGGEPQTDKISIANEFSRSVVRDGLDEAWAIFNTIKSDTAHYYLDEGEMNRTGLSMFYNGFQEKGIELLRMNTILFPNSSNVYDSYASVLAVLGKKQQAIEMYKKALMLSPTSSSAAKALKELEAKQ